MDNTAFDMATGMDPRTGVVSFGKENQLHVVFSRGSKRDNFASKAAGVPIEKQVDYVEIRTVGEKDSAIHEVTDLDRQRWSAQWARYQQGMEQRQDGTPLDVLFPRNPEIVNTLKANHIWTIQALASVSDSVTAIPFIQDHKKKATVFLDGLSGGAKFHQLESQLEEAQLKRMELEELVATLNTRLSTLETKSKTKE